MGFTIKPICKKCGYKTESISVGGGRMNHLTVCGAPAWNIENNEIEGINLYNGYSYVYRTGDYSRNVNISQSFRFSENDIIIFNADTTSLKSDISYWTKEVLPNDFVQKGYVDLPSNFIDMLKNATPSEILHIKDILGIV